MSLLATVQKAVDLAFEKADDLVGEFWLTRQQTASYNGVTGDVTTIEVEFKFDGVAAKSLTKGSFDTDTGTSGSEVDSTSQEVLLKPGEVDPVVGDVLRVGEQRHRVIFVDAVKPDGETVVLWQLKVSV